MPLELDQTDTWVFDLDNTLYPSSCDLFGLMDERMEQFVAQLLDVDRAEAFRIQKRYFVDHGTTLAGLMRHHDVNPHDYLDFVHDIPLERLSPDTALAVSISALPGRKIIFTNADAVYAQRVLKARGLSKCFEEIFDIHAAQYAPKPDAEAYDRFCAAHEITPNSAIMFEDMARNLRPAKERGMGTVWINNGSEHGDAEACPSFIDAETHDLGHWLAAHIGAMTT